MITQDLTLWRGHDFEADFFFEDADGQPIDLTGWSFYSQARKVASGDLVKDLAPVLQDAEAGHVRITVPRAAPLPEGRFVWDMVADDPDGLRWPEPLVAGNLIFATPVTKP
jgi:hypothetical protein